MTSGQELGPMVGELAYAATKGAISAFTRTLAQELAPIGITVNAVNPGPTDSTWMNDEIRKYLLPKFPMGRIGSPEDVARVISFLASESSMDDRTNHPFRRRLSTRVDERIEQDERALAKDV